MFVKKLLLKSSLFLLAAFIPASWPSPFGLDIENDSPSIPEEGQALVERVATQNTCTASWIRTAESSANKGPHQTISTLCSSLLSKYKTVTHSVYTKTVTPRTTIDEATTAPGQFTTATQTTDVTQISTDIEESTSVTTITATYTTSVVTHDETTVTALEPEAYRIKRRAQYPCQQIESILHLPSKSATPFCSCYIPSSTSTKTVTYDGATTAAPVHVTDYTTTVTLTPSTVFTTVVDTVSLVTTVESGTVVTDTVTATTTITDDGPTQTTTVYPAASVSGIIQVDDPSSSYNTQYAYMDLSNNGGDLLIVQFTTDKSSATTFKFYDNGVFAADDGLGNEFLGDQQSYDYAGDLADNRIMMVNENRYGGDPSTALKCTVAPLTSLLSCNEAPYDARTTFVICPDTSVLPCCYNNPTFLLLDTTVPDTCESALLKVIPAD